MKELNSADYLSLHTVRLEEHRLLVATPEKTHMWQNCSMATWHASSQYQNLITRKYHNFNSTVHVELIGYRSLQALSFNHGLKTKAKKLCILYVFTGQFLIPAGNTHLGQGWSSVLGSVGSWETSAIIWVNSLEETQKNQITNNYPTEYSLIQTKQTHLISCGKTCCQSGNSMLEDFTKYIF